MPVASSKHLLPKEVGLHQFPQDAVNEQGFSLPEMVFPTFLAGGGDVVDELHQLGRLPGHVDQIEDRDGFRQVLGEVFLHKG